jgi:hypothetical protein
MRKFLWGIILILLIAGAGFFYWRFYFVFGEGTKAGEMNYFVKKGYLFKTYEGKLIQTGYKSLVPGSIQSNEIEFSVESESVAQQIMNNSGHQFEVHYKEYLGALPWRGNSKYVVDSVLTISDAQLKLKGIQ